MKILIQPFLFLLSLPYGLVNVLRNYLYDKGYIKSTKFAHPVISVGNLSVGGTGKTPHIEYLIALLQPMYSVATLSRGYGRKTSGLRFADSESTSLTIGDEPMMYHRKYPMVTVSVSENRLIAIPEILANSPANQVILLDDAYQHRSVRAGLSILLTAYDKPFYEDYVMPAGMLREPKSEYKRADIIIVTKCKNEMTEAERKAMLQKIQAYSYQHVYFSSFTYGTIYGMFVKEFMPMDALKNFSVILFTAIANDEAMITYLKGKVKEVYPLKFGDHHYFDRFDIESLNNTFNNIQEEQKMILTTEKDATRIVLLREIILEKKLPIYILPVKVSFSEKDKKSFESDIQDYMGHTLQKINNRNEATDESMHTFNV